MESLQISVQLTELILNKLNVLPVLELKLSDINTESSLNDDNSVGKFRITRTLKEEFSLAKVLEVNEKEVMKPPMKRRASALIHPKAPKVLANDPKTVQNTTPIGPPKTQMFAEVMLDGEKSFMCVKCTYKTKVNSNIHKHYRLKHSDNLPLYRCKSCQFSSAEKSLLKKHYMNTHQMAESIAKFAVDATRPN